MKLTLKQMILNALELNNHDKNLIAEVKKVCGYANLENFKKTLKKETGDIEKLDGFLRVAKLLFPKDHLKLIREFAESLNPDTITMRLMLEVAHLYGKKELKKILIEKLKQSNKAESNEWANIYELDTMIAEGTLSLCDGIKEINSLKVTKPETKVFANIALMYCHYDLRNYTMVSYLLDIIEDGIKDIKNQFLKNSYFGRLFMMKVDINLHTDEISNLLQQLFMLDDALDIIKSRAYMQIGNSFMFKSHEKSMKYLKLALANKTDNTEKSILNSINFVNLLWNHTDEYVNDGSITNEIFYYIRKGNKCEAQRKIDNYSKDTLNDYKLGFWFYYNGLLTNDKSNFYKSIEHFNKIGEKFYKQLSLMELKKQGENEYVLMALGA